MIRRLLACFRRPRCPACRRARIDPRHRGLCIACVKRLDVPTRERYRRALLDRDTDPAGYQAAIDKAAAELRPAHHARKDRT